MIKRVAVASSDGINIDLHFSKASSFYVYELNDNSYRFIENRKQDAAKRHDEEGFAVTLKLIEDCKSIVVSQIGIGALAFAHSKGFRVFEAPYPVETVMENFIKKNILKEG